MAGKAEDGVSVGRLRRGEPGFEFGVRYHICMPYYVL